MKFRRDAQKRTTDHFYLAQIAQEIKRVLSSKPSAIKLEEFLFDFTEEEDDTPTTSGRPAASVPMTPEAKQSRINHSKSIWGGLMSAAARNEATLPGAAKK